MASGTVQEPDVKVAVREKGKAPVAAAPRELTTLQGGSPAELLRVAVERGVPVESLKELVALHEHMEQREARKAFAAALRAFQRECPPIKHSRTADIKTKQGGSYQYTYAELDHIARVVAPMLDKHGLSYGWDSKVESGTLTCICTLRHDLGHSESSSFSLPVENSSAMSPQQKVGAALTFAQRRSLSAVLGLTTTDDDTDAAEVDPTPISDDQATAISDLITETGVNKARFLTYMGVESVAAIKALDYQRAIDALNRKAEKKASAEANS